MTPPPRAVRYRRLALAEQDSEKVRLLQLLAAEADRGVLFTTEWISARPTKLTKYQVVNGQSRQPVAGVWVGPSLLAEIEYQAKSVEGVRIYDPRCALQMKEAANPRGDSS
jgi:hypothetical protein